ncbi:ATP-binding protein [Thiocystis violacea]|uniref:ATP-binding protein n=1 Tax=Thiocystis violacea TaxID=13725 RepID=UPI001907D067|nr:ATP-binding protein [Thiocystis violacea]MBK1716601.1 hypothetical protein [Thiocystis violacea]
MIRKKLPIGIQTFREIREDGYYYVDKTDFAFSLIEAGKYYFLSRPRRFGKSLFIDTLAELFAGNEPLFRGLAVQDRWDWSVRYPVIRLSFGGGLVQGPQDLERKIREQLHLNQSALDLSRTEPGLDGGLAELIRRAREASGQRVVVLVDEYDKPLLDNLTRPQEARAIRDGLRNLYSVIKDSDAHIRFAFLTGVSKFSKVSIFSGLNNLRDITVSRDYSAICGYTEADLDQVFAPELEGLDRALIRRWYNGYNWTGESVYNPFDLLLLLQEREFRAWWFETGTPTFLIDLLTKQGFFTPNLARLRADEALLSAFDVDHMVPEALLWQTGYLTFTATRQIGARIEYTLGYPNLEVESALNDVLAKALIGHPARASELASRLYDLLFANDLAGLHRHFESLFASIPHQWHDTNPIARYEGYYASVFYSHLAALGLDLRVEDSCSAGRLDLALRFEGRIYLFEFKVVELEPEGRALRQIKDRGYADKYRAEGQPIHLIGVEFSRERRGLVGFEVETLEPLDPPGHGQD